MSDKRKISYDYKKLKKIKPRYLLSVSIIFLVIGVYGLRQNYSEMVRLRTAVSTADEQNGDVETALRNLRQFVYNHMNTNLSSGNVSIKPPIQLKYRYERLAKSEEKKASEENKAVKQKADAICLQKYPGKVFNSNRVNCVAKYISDNSVKPHPIPSDLYKFDFMSPSWSPDLAGISLLFSLMFFLAFIARLVLGAWYKSLLG